MRQKISEYKTEKKKLGKKLLIPLFAILLIGSVFAVGYVVHSINLTVDVKEPFIVQYTILGDGGNYVFTTEEQAESDCNAGTWLTLDNEGVFDKDGFYPMESRYVCIKITNAGEASIPYIITSTTTGSDNIICKSAFPDVQKTETAVYGENVDGALVTIPADAIPINDCNVKIEVARGTLPSP